MGRALTIEVNIVTYMPKLPSLTHPETLTHTAQHLSAWLEALKCDPMTLRSCLLLSLPLPLPNLTVTQHRHSCSGEPSESSDTPLLTRGVAVPLNSHRLAQVPFHRLSAPAPASAAPACQGLLFLSFLLRHLVISGRFGKTWRENADIL